MQKRPGQYRVDGCNFNSGLPLKQIHLTQARNGQTLYFTQQELTWLLVLLRPSSASSDAPLGWLQSAAHISS